MAETTIEIRVLQTLDEYRDAEILQHTIWQMPDDLEVVPLPLLVTAQKNGGLVLGAFEGSRQVGMLFGFLGRTSGGMLKHCSHIMGVLPSHRGRGIGRLLKQRQQALVRAQGIDLITWTYDPLETANATLNIGRLGAICRTYLRNVYGEMSDELNRGLPTDRFEVEWWSSDPSPTGRGALIPSTDTAEEDFAFPPRHGEAGAMPIGHPARGGPPGSIYPPANETVESPAGLPAPGTWQLVEASSAAVTVPGNFQRLKARDLDLALAWRLHTRTIFEAYFAAGFVIVDFVRRGPGDGSGIYLLTRPEQVALSTGE